MEIRHIAQYRRSIATSLHRPLRHIPTSPLPNITTSVFQMTSEYIKSLLFSIEKSIRENVFIDVEQSKIELKDLSTGNDWTSLKETICAFLNTDGGIVVCGVRERNKQYKFTGFNRTRESNLLDLQTKFFKNDYDVLVDLSGNIAFEYLPFMTNEVAIIVVRALPEDKKFVKFNDIYYERKLTQDKIITATKLQRQREYKADLENTKELSFVEKAQLQDLSLDKINRYTHLLNAEIKIETTKPSLVKAKPFLSKQYFLIDDKVTTLGMLVCGDDPFHFLENRAEVNCYYDTSLDIAVDKKILRNDVINLMEDTFRYVWGHIKIARTVKDGGRSEPEYPEKLVREIINNALAHRDYTLNGFVSIKIEPDKHLEIKNPGSFKEKIKCLNTETEIPVRRLIAGIPESKNPKLASVLKVFDRIESQGRGMASLVNAALNNHIDLPYYQIKQDAITLVVPSGKLLDETAENWLAGFNTYIVSKLQQQPTPEHKAVLTYFYKSELLNRQRYFTILLSESNNHFVVIDQLKQAQLLYEHAASTEENPIYVLDRVLMKTNYASELLSLIGEEYHKYDQITQETLNLLYQFTQYNQTPLRPFQITPEVYRRIFGKTIVAKPYETLGRKVRSICKSFEKKGILKINDNGYVFNNRYKQNKTSLF